MCAEGFAFFLFIPQTEPPSHTHFRGLPRSPRPPLLRLRGPCGLLRARALPCLVPASAHGSRCGSSSVLPVDRKHKRLKQYEEKTAAEVFKSTPGVLKCRDRDFIAAGSLCSCSVSCNDTGNGGAPHAEQLRLKLGYGTAAQRGTGRDRAGARRDCGTARLG